MPKVRLKSIYATPEKSAWPGDVIEVPAEEAKQLIDGRYAEEVEAETPVTAVATGAPATPATGEGSAPAQGEIASLEGVPIAKVLEFVADGKLTAERAIELEKAAKKPRPSLLAQLAK